MVKSLGGDSGAVSGFVSLKKAVFGLLLIGVASRLLGLVREIIIAGAFGTSAELDAVYLGITLPLAIGFGISSGIGRAMVPLATRVKIESLGSVFRLLFRQYFPAFAVFSLLLGASAPFWGPLVTPSGSDVPLTIVIISGAIICLALPGSVLTGLLMGFSHGKNRHFSAQSVTILHNLLFIGIIILLGPFFGPLALLAAVIAAEYLQCLVMFPLIHSLRKQTTVADPEALHQGKQLVLPAILIAGSLGFFGLVDRYFAATLAEGRVSALVYADRLLNLPILLIGIAVQTPIYTRLCWYANSKQWKAFDQTLLLGITMLALFGLPTGAIVSGFSEPIIALLLERGAFTPEDSAVSGLALRGYALAIPFLGMMPLLSGAGLALRRPWPIVAIFAVGFVLNGVLDALLVDRFGILGISIATSIISTLMAMTIVLVLRPSLLNRTSFWRPIIAGFLLYVSISLGSYLWSAIWTGELSGFAERLAYLLLGLTFSLLLTLPILLWVIVKELPSLITLKNKAAKLGRLERESLSLKIDD